MMKEVTRSAVLTLNHVPSEEGNLREKRIPDLICYFTALLSSDVSSALSSSAIFSILGIGKLRPILFRCSGLSM
jgi:hypothetical protein